MVKPWNSVRKFGLDLRGPDIRPGLYNRHLIIEGHKKVIKGHGRSLNVMESQGRSRKDYSVSPSPSPFPLDFGLGCGTWIWDLDLGPGFGDLVLGLDLGLTIIIIFIINLGSIPMVNIRNSPICLTTLYLIEWMK